MLRGDRGELSSRGAHCGRCVDRTRREPLSRARTRVYACEQSKGRGGAVLRSSVLNRHRPREDRSGSSLGAMPSLEDFQLGDLVLAKVGSYPPWPAKVSHVLAHAAAFLNRARACCRLESHCTSDESAARVIVAHELESKWPSSSVLVQVARPSDYKKEAKPGTIFVLFFYPSQVYVRL